MSEAHSASRAAAELLTAAPLPAADGSTPAYQRIERWIGGLVNAGTLGRGDRLPSEAELARAIGVSRMTLRQALAGLETRGVVERVPGRSGGTFIREPTIEVDITGLAGFTEQLRRGQVRAGARVVRAGRIRADVATASALQVPAGSDVFEIVRVRSARRQPLALERSLLPCALFPGLLEGGLSGSLYARMRHDYDLAPHTATEHLEPCLADDAVAGLLDVAPGSALLRIVRTASSAAGQPIEHASDLFRPDRVRISVRARIT